MSKNTNFDSVGINKYTRTIYDEDGYTIDGFDKNGIHKNTKTKYDKDGFDKSGYNKDYDTRDEIMNIDIMSASSFIHSREKTYKKSVPKIKLGLLDKFKKREIEKRANDEVLYEYVLDELEQDIKFKGLWAKAYANSEGNENKIEPLYMQYRVQAIKDQFTTLEIAYNEMSRKMLFEYIKNKLT